MIVSDVNVKPCQCLQFQVQRLVYWQFRRQVQVAKYQANLNYVQACPTNFLLVLALEHGVDKYYFRVTEGTISILELYWHCQRLNYYFWV